MKTNNNLLKIVAQAFYGNRTGTEVKVENLDSFILGYTDNFIKVTEKIDRTVVKIPNTNNLVIVYNKHQEEEKKDLKRKPLAVIPEKDIKIYSRCVVCRMNENGEFESLQNEDYKKFMKYLEE